MYELTIEVLPFLEVITSTLFPLNMKILLLNFCLLFIPTISLVCIFCYAFRFRHAIYFTYCFDCCTICEASLLFLIQA